MTARQAAPKRYRPPAPERHFDDGYDTALFNVGHLLLDMRDDGATDAEQADAVLELVGLRMQLGAENPVHELTGGGHV